MIFHSESLPEVLRQLGKKVNTDASIRITVRRTAVWTDALHEAQKKSFSPFSLLKVSYVSKCTVPSTHKFTLARECTASQVRVERKSCSSAISPRYECYCDRHSSTDLRHSYISFMLLIVNVFVPAVLL